MDASILLLAAWMALFGPVVDRGGLPSEASPSVPLPGGEGGRTSGFFPPPERPLLASPVPGEEKSPQHSLSLPTRALPLPPGEGPRVRPRRTERPIPQDPPVPSDPAASVSPDP